MKRARDGKRESIAGQSLTDVLVGLALCVILVFAAIAAIAPALRSGSQATGTQSVTWLANGLLDNVKSWSDSDWHNILSVATGTNQKWYLITSSSPYTATSGVESVVLGTSTYNRYFYVMDVYRDSSGNIATSGTVIYDPSTKQVFVVFGWKNGGTSTVSEYLTRNQTQATAQVDWTGGPGNSTSAVSSSDFRFASSTNVDYSSTPGSIIVNNL